MLRTLTQKPFIRSVFFLTLLVSLSFNICQARDVIDIRDNWQFVKSDVALNAPDVEWETVSIPHSWNTVDGQNGGGSRTDPSVGYYRGKCSYQKLLKIDADPTKQRVFLKFEGASIVTDTYLNGKHLGQHKGAFTAFCYEITDKIIPGSDNLLQVKVDNSFNPDIPPLSGDFTMFGGIYRPAELIVTDKICITPLDYASPGVYISQKNVCDAAAEIEILTKIDSTNTQSQQIEIVSQILDADGKLVNKKLKTLDIKPGELLPAKQTITMAKPHLWDGLKDPYLYGVKVDILQDGKVIDSVTQALGIRSFRVDPKKGFFLNDKSYQIRGVNRHQDRKDHGWAISLEDHTNDHDLIREIGANGVRLAHYPHSNDFLNLCDRSGLLVWAEIPLVNQITDSEQFSDNSELQLVELIRQQYNHPSIFCWSLWNELMHQPSPNPVKLITRLNQIAKKEDPYRYTAAGANGASSKAKGLREITDLIAWNTYPGWYGGSPSGLGKNVDKYNLMNKNKGVGISEYGAGASINHHEQSMTKGPNPKGKWHPEQWQAILHEESYEQIQQRDYIWGTFVWNMFNFGSIWRTEGDADGINDKGLVTYDRKVRKDAFFFYKANWNPEPMVYITSRRHVERTQPITEVKVYSNAEKVELYVNGQSQGKTTPNTVNIFRWEDIQLRNGKNQVRAVATINNKKTADSCTWQLKQAPAEKLKKQ